MEQQRTLLLIALFVVMFLLWSAWQRDYVMPKQAPTTATQTSPQPTAAANKDHEVPTAGDTPAPVTDHSSKVVVQQHQASMVSSQRIHVRTDFLDVELDSRGGDVRRVGLLKYPVSSKEKDKPLELMNDQPPHLFIAQDGFAGKKPMKNGSLTAAPNQNTLYQVSGTNYVLHNNQNEIVVPFTWTSPDGVKFIKRYRFNRSKYLIQVEHIIENPTGKEWQGNLYTQLQRMPIPKADQPRFIHTYTGGVIYSDEHKYEKIDFDDMTKHNLSRGIKGGWAAMIQHYFLGAWIPNDKQNFNYYTRVFDKDRYVIGMTSPTYKVEPGKTKTLESKLFVGPKLQTHLESIAPGLELTVDYGYLTFIAKPIFWLLRTIHSMVHNWGWSIIFLTLIIKLAFYKLSETSYKSMANMRRMQPRMKALKERFGDDRAQMNKALMDLYKKEKINPLGGCLPIVVQIPVFISLYWVLLESVELRQAPFMLWIQDMSSPDPYFILPIIMGVTMLIQQRLNPTPMDPIQAKLMMVLPFAFGIFFSFFPAGLVLYWVVNNTLSISQQWYITRVVIEKGK